MYSAAVVDEHVCVQRQLREVSAVDRNTHGNPEGAFVGLIKPFCCLFGIFAVLKILRLCR